MSMNLSCVAIYTLRSGKKLRGEIKLIQTPTVVTYDILSLSTTKERYEAYIAWIKYRWTDPDDVWVIEQEIEKFKGKFDDPDVELEFGLI